MSGSRHLLCIFAHPDDEAMGMGGTLALYAAAGVEISLILATRGERGWSGEPAANPGLRAAGQLREQEVRAAAAILGIRHLHFLDYLDGELDRAAPAEAIARIARLIRQLRPQVVVTFGPEGSYGHTDHIAISQLTSAAIIRAADAAFDLGDMAAPHQVAKLYFLVDPPEMEELIVELGLDLVYPVDGVERRLVPWPSWAITTWIDAADYWETAWRAIACHRSQLPNLDYLTGLPESVHRRLWRNGAFYRVFSLVNGGRQIEHDLFEGIGDDNP